MNYIQTGSTLNTQNRSITVNDIKCNDIEAKTFEIDELKVTDLTATDITTTNLVADDIKTDDLTVEGILTVDNNFQNGSYTPVVSVETNCSGINVTVNQYLRVGNIVLISFQAAVTPTTDSDFNFRITIPVGRATNFTASAEALGSLPQSTGTTRPLLAIAVSGTQLIQLGCNGGAGTSGLFFFGNFTYQLN